MESQDGRGDSWRDFFSTGWRSHGQAETCLGTVVGIHAITPGPSAPLHTQRTKCQASAQQYGSLTHSRQVEITGQAVAGGTVELTLDGGTPFTVDRSLPQHQTGDPHSFRYAHTVTHSEARWLHVQIKASAGGIDVVKEGFIYVPPAAFSPSYDLDGNLTEDEQWQYTWDAENRMTSATQKAFPVAAGVSLPPPARLKLTFAHDYRNRRIAKRVFQLETSNLEPETPTWHLVKDLRFVYDGYQMIAELDHTFATGTGLEGSRVNRTFLWGPDVSGTMTGAGGVGGLLSTTYQGVTYHVCSDANGNVTGLVPGNGPQAGTLIARYDYDPFGNRITNTGPDVDICPFGFSTKYTDSETGIVHYDLRDYSPQLGRFISADPIQERGGVNLYGFVGNDAVNRWDYLGLAVVEMVLHRDLTGYFAVYGSLSVNLKLSSDAERKKFACCGSLFPLKFKTLESVGVTLKDPGTHTPSISPEQSWATGKGAEGSGFPIYTKGDKKGQYVGGFTSIRGKLEFGFMAAYFTQGSAHLPDKPESMNQVDYEDVINQELHMSAGDGKNIRFGPNSNHSTGCLLVGSTYINVSTQFKGDRFGLARVNGEEAWYDNVPGFDLQDSIDSQFKLFRAIQCAKKNGATIKYRVENAPPKRHSGAAAVPRQPDGSDGIPFGKPMNF